MTLELRKLVTSVEYTHREGDQLITPPVVMAGVTATIKNPWAGHGFVQDLDPVIALVTPELAHQMVPLLIECMGGPDKIEAFGKAALAGLDGEIEHAAAMIHTLRFGNVYREAAEGTSYLSFTNKRGPAGTTLSIPMVHKTDRAHRSHFLTYDVHVPDAPRPDELLVAIGASSSGRPLARIGDRKADAERGAV